MKSCIAIVGVTLLTGVASPPSASAQEIFVRDLRCRAQAITACIADIKQRVCDRGSPRFGGGPCNGPYRDTPDEEHANGCAAKVDNLQAGTCLIPVNLQAVINSLGVITELKETARILRDDQRALLNEVCRAVGGQPDKCDESLPPKK